MLTSSPSALNHSAAVGAHKGSLNPQVSQAPGARMPPLGSAGSAHSDLSGGRHSVARPELKPGASYYPGADLTEGSHAPAAPPESHPYVRAVMHEEVLGTLRRTAVLATILLTAFAIYDYFEWRSNYIVEADNGIMYRVLLLRLLGIVPICGGAATVLYFIPLKGPQAS